MLGNPNARDPGVRHRTAHECDITHSREAQIADIQALAVQEPLVFLAPQPRANSVFRQCTGLPR